MRNDARPIGEEFRDIAEHDHHKTEKGRPNSADAAEDSRAENTPFVVNRDPGDEELPSDSSDR
jgi:hypothetical protein